MSFVSLGFFAFLLVVVMVYYLLPTITAKKVFLLGASYYFYASWNVAYLAVLLFITLVSFFVGGRLKKGANKLLPWTVIILLLPLLTFKYLSFLLQTIQDLMSLSGWSLTVPSFKLLLPVGISFYTFMAIAYVVDVQKGKVVAENSLLDYALFLGFFPQIASGPIGRAGQLLPQLKGKHPVLYNNVAAGVRMMIWGFFMKLVVGDRAGIYVDTVFGNYAQHNGTSLFLATLFYTVQIYCDFAGYSLIAIGTAKTMGIDLMTNFKRPYFAVSVSDFWRRWHISLSTWLRDYVYIPLGGNRVGKAKHYRNLIVTFLVSGLWHGAGYNYVIWGGYHGASQVLAKVFKPYKDKMRRKCGINDDSMVGRIFDILVTFVIVSYGWMLFYAPDFSFIMDVTKGYFHLGKPYVHQTTFFFFFIGLAILTIKEIRDEFFPGKLLLTENKNVIVRYLSVTALVALIVYIGVLGGGQFIYFQF